MIRTFEKKKAKWSEVCIINLETNDFIQFCYEIINGKLLKFSEHADNFDVTYWVNNNRKWFKMVEVENNFLDFYPLWNPATDLTEELRRERGIFQLREMITNV
jgi:hypothetical protein